MYEWLMNKWMELHEMKHNAIKTNSWFCDIPYYFAEANYSYGQWVHGLKYYYNNPSTYHNSSSFTACQPKYKRYLFIPL